MLNPPLSLLSDDLLVSIVEQLAKLRFTDTSGDLRNLSLADRAFTHSCQNYIFRKLKFGSGTKISKQLTKGKKFLEDKPLFSNRVRVIELGVAGEKPEGESLFKDPEFTSILELFAKSPMPPYELRFRGWWVGSIIEDPIFLIRQVTESFFSQTLTILCVRNIANVPLPLFFICPRLREVVLERVGPDNSYDKYPINQCSGREAPLLEVLELRDSYTLVEQIIAPPPMFNTPLVPLSNLRVLSLLPNIEEEMDCLQPILDAACNTLEELYLIISTQQLKFLLAGLVNLSNLSNLKAFSLFSIVDCEPSRGENAPMSVSPPLAVLQDINTVLRTIPKSNRVTNLWFHFVIIGVHPFRECLDQDWVGIFNEVIRIGDGKPLELEFAMSVCTDDVFETVFPGEDELYMRIMEKAAFLSFHPNICIHWWNSTFRNRYGICSPPIGQVHTRCRK